MLIDSLALIREPFGLSVAGYADDLSYAETVRAAVAGYGLADRVDWLGEVSRANVIEHLRSHDVLVYPSIGIESGWLGVLEGLAAGSVVVSSAPGAPHELLRDGENALLFAPGDADALARCLDAMADDPALPARLRAGALRTAAEHTLDAMLDRIESLLRRS